VTAARKLDIGLLEKAKDVYEAAVTKATAVFSPDSDNLLKCAAKASEIDEILAMLAHSLIRLIEMRGRGGGGRREEGRKEGSMGWEE
jgi:hypothetical protein